MLMGNMGLYRNGATFGQLFVLDQIATPSVAAFSLRKLKKDYQGAAIRVRRSSDNTESDIGFNINGDLDTISLLSFVGSSNGFVTIWYDQSDNRKDAIQTVALMQPRIVNAGLIDTDKNKPTIVYSGAQWLQTASGLFVAANGTWTGNSVFSVTTFGSIQSILDCDNGSTIRLAQFIRSSTASAVDAIAFNTSNTAFSSSAGTGVSAQARIATGICSLTNITSFVDGVIGTSTTITGTIKSISGPLNIGGRLIGSNYLIGKISESIIFPSVFSNSNRQLLERNQGAYYNIPVI